MAWAGRGLHRRRGVGGRNRAYDLSRVRRILCLLCRQLAATWRSLLHNLQVAKESKKIPTKNTAKNTAENTKDKAPGEEELL